jgi:NTE family protein
LKFDFRSQINDSINRRDLFIEEKRWLEYGALNFNIDKDLSLNIPMSILSGNNMLQKLSKYLSRGMYYKTFDEYPIPFRSNATNLTTGESVTFTEGNIIDVVRASMAFPTLLEPFEVNGELFVDGGVKDNLPVAALTDMGANYIIANKVSTPLKGKDECQDFITILNQTNNINMNVWVEEAVSKSNLVIVPELNSYNNSSFDDMEDIIRLGEEKARENIAELIRLKSIQGEKKKQKHVFIIPDHFLLNSITTSGNNVIHSTKIKLYSGLKDDSYYTYNEILEASKKCYNTKYFYWVYPKLSYDDGQYNLEIVVKEKEKIFFSIDVVYDTSDDLVARLTTTMNNVVQKNSKLIGSFQLGGVNSLVFDYVKNFGDLYGAYYHVFPYFLLCYLSYYLILC